MLAEIRREFSSRRGFLIPSRHRAAGDVYRGSNRVIQFAYVISHPERVLRLLDAVESDKLCPCNWQKARDWGGVESRLNPRLRVVNPFRDESDTFRRLLEVLPSYAPGPGTRTCLFKQQPELSEQQT
jgi:hypothetical protein